MVSSAATTVANYLAQLSADRRASVERVRAVVNAHLPPGYEEGMQYGMIGWYVPLARYPSTYNGQPLCLASLASRKQHLSLYMMTVYGGKDIERFLRAGFLAAGKKLDMGESCVRFKTADALALDVIGATIAKLSVEQYITWYENIRDGTRTGAKPKLTVTAAKSKAAKSRTAKPKTQAAKPEAKGATPKRTATLAKPKANRARRR